MGTCRCNSFLVVLPVRAEPLLPNVQAATGRTLSCLSADAFWCVFLCDWLWRRLVISIACVVYYTKLARRHCRSPRAPHSHSTRGVRSGFFFRYFCGCGSRCVVEIAGWEARDPSKVPLSFISGKALILGECLGLPAVSETIEATSCILYHLTLTRTQLLAALLGSRLARS